MKSYLYLNGKKVTKLDIAHIIDSLLPAWHGNYWLLTDVLSYAQLVDALEDTAEKCSTERLNKKLSYYYSATIDIRAALNQDINAYYLNN